MQQSKKETSKPTDTTMKPTINPKSKNEPNVNVASGSKGKEKLINERSIDDSEEEEPNEHELKRRKAREAQIDEHNRIVREVEEKEKAEREAQVTLETRKLLFTFQTLERIMSEDIDIPSQYWLELVMSYELLNTQDSQLDLPITPKPFKYRSFVKVVNVRLTDSGADRFLFSFYLKHMKPQ